MGVVNSGLHRQTLVPSYLKPEKTVQAAYQMAYGSPDVLALRSMPNPEPGPGQVLIRVIASAVTAADTLMRKGTPRFARLFLGVFRPRQVIPGTGFSGIVEAVGPGANRFAPGDSVMGESIFGGGANCEYVCISQNGLLLQKPVQISFSAAATVCDGALTAYHFLNTLGGLQANQQVLVNGAAGSLGSAAVQLAKLAGAKVTGICSTRNIEFVRSLGADEVIDYTSTRSVIPNESFDLVFDSVGKLTPRQGLNALREHGRYLSPVLGLPVLLSVIMTRVFGTRRTMFSATGLLPENQLMTMLRKVSGHLVSGELSISVDREYSLVDIAQAHAYVDTGHKRGNVVLVNEFQQRF